MSILFTGTCWMLMEVKFDCLLRLLGNWGLLPTTTVFDISQTVKDFDTSGDKGGCRGSPGISFESSPPGYSELRLSLPGSTLKFI